VNSLSSRGPEVAEEANAKRASHPRRQASGSEWRRRQCAEAGRDSGRTEGRSKTVAPSAGPARAGSPAGIPEHRSHSFNLFVPLLVVTAK
jgi:hypothetical protein